MDYLDIKFALARRGYTLTRIVEELDLFGPQSVQQVLIRKYLSARVENHVSLVTGIPLEKLFPDRYQIVKRALGRKTIQRVNNKVAKNNKKTRKKRTKK